MSRLPQYGPTGHEFVTWESLGEFAKQRLLTEGHPSNRPTPAEIASGRPLFQLSGRGHIVGFLSFGNTVSMLPAAGRSRRRR